ncbi:hypothetical protein JOB18_040978 [Solea senegalensis]|uniref:Lipocalin/cytosolic fatty-acid binding domain-containing protein n=1 Tax=Solea senegalensis TaxID=28829 RepID=A0AAV6R698_SOLSE|nr:hypothetical protein JOB18_040978 [Solea senegalensis]
MQKVTSLVPLLILGSVWIHHVALETLSLIQEDFDLDRFMGKWFELTVASTCPYYLQRKRANPVILALQMQHVASGSNFTLMSTTFRNGSCKTSSVDYALTDTPGRFFHHVSSKFLAILSTGFTADTLQTLSLLQDSKQTSILTWWKPTMTSMRCCSS